MPVSFRTEVSSYSSANIGMYYLLKEYTSAAMLDSEGHQVRQFALPWDYLLRRYTQAGIHFPEEWQPRIAVPAVPAQLDDNGVVVQAAIEGIAGRGQQTHGHKPTRENHFHPAVSAHAMTGPRVYELNAAVADWKGVNDRLVSLKTALEANLLTDFLKEVNESPTSWSLDARSLYSLCIDRYKMTKQDIPLLDEAIAAPPKASEEATRDGATAFIRDRQELAAMYPPAYPKTNDQVVDLTRDACSGSKLFTCLLLKFDDQYPADLDKTLGNLMKTVETHFTSVYNQCERAKIEGAASATQEHRPTQDYRPAQSKGATTKKSEVCDKWLSEIGGCTNARCPRVHPAGEEGSKPEYKRFRDQIKTLQTALKEQQPPKGKSKNRQSKRGKGGSSASAAGGGAAPEEEDEEDT